MASVTHKSMALGVLITSTTATLRQTVYNASNGIATIEKCTVKNDHGSTSFDVYIYLRSTTSPAGTVVEQVKATVPADSTVSITDVVGHKVPSGGVIQVHSTSATELSITISGIERIQ